MNYTSLALTNIVDGGYAFLAYDLEFGFRLLEQRVDLNAVYFRDLSDPDTDGINNTPISSGATLNNSKLVDLSGPFASLENSTGSLIKIGDTWATIVAYNSAQSLTVDNYPARLPPIQSISIASPGVVTMPGHGMSNDTPIKFSSTGAPPTPLVSGTTYYARNVTTDTFTVSASPGGGSINTTGPGYGDLFCSLVYSVYTTTFDADKINDTIIGKVFRQGSTYTMESYYDVTGSSVTPLEFVSGLPAVGNFVGQVVINTIDNLIYTWNGVAWVTGTGEQSRSVKLSTDIQAFQYNSQGNIVGGTAAVITATPFNTVGDLSYGFKIDGVLPYAQEGVSPTFAYTANSLFSGMPDVVEVDLFENAVIVATDLITIFGVQQGSDAITIILSNEAHTVPAASDGSSPNLTGSGTTIQVYKGPTQIPYDDTVTYADPSFRVSIVSSPNITPGTITGTGFIATVPDHTAMGASALGYVELAITILDGGTETVYTKLQSVTKSIAGVSGTTGLSNATLSLYSKNTSAVTPPTAFTGTATYTFSTKALTGLTLGTWTTTIPTIAQGEYLWVRQAIASSATDTDTIDIAEWSGAVVLTNGSIDGLNSAPIFLYNKNTSDVTPPTAFTGTATYTFSSQALSGLTLNSWSRTPPSLAQGEYLWLRQAVASSNTNTDTIAIGEWSTAAVVGVAGTDGTPGVAGYNNATLSLYSKNTSAVTPPTAFTGTATYTFSTKALTGLTLGTWTTTIPTIAQGEYLWVRQAVASSLTDTDTILIAEWSGAVVLSNGAIDGLNSVPIFLYNKNTSDVTAPTSFTGTASYTFSTNTLSGLTLNSWTRSPPSLVTGEYLWVRQVVASSNTDIDSIPIGEWSVAAVVGGAGANGATGPAGLNTATVSLYSKNTSAVSPPAAFTGTATYTFATGGITGLTLGTWAAAIPTIVQGEYVWVRQAIASANTATDTIAIGEWSGAVVLSGAGINGLNSVPLFLYAKNTSGVTPPAAFTGTATYTFATDALTGLTLGTWTRAAPSLSTGEYLWFRQAIASSTGTTDTIAIGEWSAAAVLGAPGSTGGTGATGNSAKLAYAKGASNFAFSGATSIAGAAAAPLPVTGNWGLTATWYATPGEVAALATGESLYQVTGIYNPTTTVTTWAGYPYLSNLKVGSLSAISADLGTVTAGTIRGGTIVTAGSFTIGITYIIETTGTTSFTAIGAANNDPDTQFTATGVGTGTGTALTAQRILINNETVRVYDTAGTLRVRLGIW